MHLLDEEPPEVVWKRLGEDEIRYSVEEVEEMIVTTRPPLGGSKVRAHMCEFGGRISLFFFYTSSRPLLTEVMILTTWPPLGGSKVRVHT